MSVTQAGNKEQAEIRHSLALADLPENRPWSSKPKKKKTARLKIINGRPYYYAVENIWNKETKTCRQVSRYLGKTLPRGYRLIK